jgi:predicted DNA-binding transcriptional regulator AlpA
METEMNPAIQRSARDREDGTSEPAVEPRAAPAEPRLRIMLSEAQVLKIVPVSPSTLSRMEKDKVFPKSTYVSANRKIWYEDEIIAWQSTVNGTPRRRNRRQ